MYDDLDRMVHISPALVESDANIYINAVTRSSIATP